MSLQRKLYLKTACLLSAKINLENLQKFEFNKVVTEAEEIMPATSEFITALFPDPSSITRYKSFGTKLNKR